MSSAGGFRAGLVAVVVAGAVAAGAAATPVIDVGGHVLLPDTPGQTIELFVTGGDLVQGLNLYVQVADGYPTGGGVIDGPNITGVDVVTGTIFTPSNTGQDTDVALDQIWLVYTTTDEEIEPFVSAEGRLATVTLDTTGFPSGTWELRLADTLNLDSDFAGVAADIRNGTIEIQEPPAVIVVGDHELLGNDPDQSIQVFVSGAAAVNALDLFAEIVPAEPGATGVAPTIASVDVLTETIFAGNNTGAVTVPDGPRFSASTAAADGKVVADGLLATITIDASGIAPGTDWRLLLTDTSIGDTDLAGAAMDITNGTLAVVPGPRTLAGDADLDGVVGRSDFLALRGGFGEAGATWTGGDFNLDGVTDYLDYILVKTNVSDALPAAALAPEPGAIVLLALGGLAGLIRRRR
jgi:hypothetical protein